MAALQSTGLQEDCPFSLEEGAEQLSPDSVREVSDEAFGEYAGRLNSYLQARALPSLHRTAFEHIMKICSVSQKLLFCGDDTFGMAVQLELRCVWCEYRTLVWPVPDLREAGGHACKEKDPKQLLGSASCQT